MRAVWSGSISFGLVNVPVKAYSAVEDHDISFHQVHHADGGRIRYERRCEVCGKKVEYKDIDKAFEEDGDTVVMTDEDFAALPESDNDEIEVVQFVPADQVDPIMLERSYYLEPEGKSPKSYLLLRQTLQDTDRTAIVTFSLRQKTRLGALRVSGKVLLLQGMLWPDEVREVDFPAVKSRTKIGEKELKLSASLVEQYASDFTPEAFEDEYQVELRKLIDAKLESGETLDTAATFGESADGKNGDDGADGDGEDAEVIDLMEALKASLDRKRGGTSGGSSGSSQPARKATSKTSEGTSSGTKKSAQKPAAKTPAKKSAPKKSATKSAPKKKSA